MKHGEKIFRIKLIEHHWAVGQLQAALICICLECLKTNQGKGGQKKILEDIMVDSFPQFDESH